MTLHWAELIVNVVRDETTWRRTANGGRSRSNAPVTMLRSFPALILFALKLILHWLYSLSIGIYFSLGLNMRPPQILYLSIGAFVLALFTTICVFWKPAGPQPANFGHLQTLVDLVDEWPKEKETLYWGHKDVEISHQDSGIALDKSKPTNVTSEEQEPMLETTRISYHAGTATRRLGNIDFHEVYMG